MIPGTTIDTHRLTPYVHHDAMNKGMYGLPQAGLLAQQRLIAHLATHGYHETSTPCLFRHTSNGTAFTRVVDDFGIKYSSQAGADHLIRTLQLLYVITIDWNGSKYIGFTIRFNDKNRQVSLTMPGYIDNNVLPHIFVSVQLLQPFTLPPTMVPQRKHPSPTHP